MSFDRVVCPICDGTDFSDLSGDGGYAAYRCKRCSLGVEQRLSKNPAQAYKRQIYDEQPIRNDDASDRWLRYHHDSAVAVDRLRQLVALLPRNPQANGPQLWVDVGCANGATLTAVRRAGWTPLGVEADPHTAAETAGVLGVPVLSYAAWMLQPPQNAAIVSFFDSLEHMLDPVGALLTASRSLRPGGVLIIEAPDLGDRTTVRDWKHRRIGADFTEHIWHFSEMSLRAMVQRYTPELQPTHIARPIADRIQFACQLVTAPASPIQHEREREGERERERERRMHAASRPAPVGTRK